MAARAYYDRARDYLAQAHSDITAGVLMADIGLTRSQANLVLWRFERRGEIERVQRGVYRATQAA